MQGEGGEEGSLAEKVPGRGEKSSSWGGDDEALLPPLGAPRCPPHWSLDTLEPHEPESAVSESIVPAPRGSET